MKRPILTVVISRTYAFTGGSSYYNEDNSPFC